MLGGLLILSLSFLAASAETGKHWALIVAGSNGWYNYRHQVIIIIGKQTSYELQGPILLFRPKNKCANSDQSRTLFSLSRHDASNRKLKLLNLSTYLCLILTKWKSRDMKHVDTHFRFWTEDIWELGCKGNCITTDCLRDILFFSFPLFSFIGRTACVTRFSVRC